MEQKYLVFIVSALVIGLAAGSALTYALLQWTRRIPSTATIKVMGVEVYKDANFTVVVTEVDWGMVEPGDQKNWSCYIRNESNVPITLSLYTEDWTPSNASSFITLAWDYEGSMISVEGSTPVTFTLTVDSGISGIDSFSFTIVIVGKG